MSKRVANKRGVGVGARSGKSRRKQLDKIAKRRMRQANEIMSRVVSSQFAERRQPKKPGIIQRIKSFVKRRT